MQQLLDIQQYIKTVQDEDLFVIVHKQNRHSTV
jgi:tryptophan 2,3-dioxygenase